MIETKNQLGFLSLLSFAVLGLILLAGCASTKTIEIEMTAAADVNPNRQGQPSPLVVTIYQIKDDKTFKLSDFYALYYQPKETLEENLLGTKQVELTPNTKKKISWAIDKKTQYLGIVAAYRNIDTANWQLVTPIPNSLLGIGTPSIQLEITRHALKQK